LKATPIGRRAMDDGAATLPALLLLAQRMASSLADSTIAAARQPQADLAALLRIGEHP